MKPVLVAALRGYQFAIRPMLGANCRFFPSCSDYAIEALERQSWGMRVVLPTCRRLESLP